jgi:hypothetical protein
MSIAISVTISGDSTCGLIDPSSAMLRPGVPLGISSVSSLRVLDTWRVSLPDADAVPTSSAFGRVTSEGFLLD